MRTQLGTYCQQFDGILRPALDDLAAALRAIDDAPSGMALAALRGPLASTQHDVQALCDKVKEQQAYVLIFGPLKSGKSTLMNAVAAAYVSEVSSLPAYPCLVFTSAGKQREYLVTSYDGNQRRFTTAPSLHDHIDSAHRELARAIRQAEEKGHEFDPQEHFPAAIRRVDVRVPDSELQATGAVLVDTPGLYTRMRFGYDRMTRDFRNAAACAIFVVKSDTLFLEQVFAEFQQLLDLFSRIFLVVNVDSQKRDVSPDGKLVPSLEQSQPEAVLRAFEHLAMSAPLQKAANEGRVRMYPVDLLHAASSVLRKAPIEETPASFRAFRQDLADYLASSEYMAAFLRDSLQRGQHLLGDAAAVATGAECRRLQQRLADLDQRLVFLDREQERVQRALAADLAPAFVRGQGETFAAIERCARDSGSKLLRTLGASIDTWFLSSHSLEWLVQGQWNPLVRDYRDDVLAAGRRALDQQLLQNDSGLDLPDEITELLDRAGVEVRDLRVAGVAALGAVTWPAAAGVPVDVAAIPIRKGVLDLVSFRSVDRVRERIFGPAGKPETKIPAKEKASRLGEPGRLHLHKCVTSYRAELAPQTIAVLREFFGAKLTAATVQVLHDRLRAYAPRLAEERQRLLDERTRADAVAGPLRRVEAAAVRIRGGLAELGKQFENDVRSSAPAKDPVLQPQPRREHPEKADKTAPTPTRPAQRADRPR